MAERYRSVFSYYGGKSKIINCYPEPKHDFIIEPFAGAAAYAYRWRDRRVWINELDTRTASIWEFLLGPDALEWINTRWPETLGAGERIGQVFTACPAGLVELARAEANQGTQGASGVHDTVTSMATKVWPRLKEKFLTIIPTISHWRLTQRDYRQLASPEPATWFIDPPYSNPAGQRYRLSDLDYPELATWATSRPGQVIVCENAGADWLKFEPLEHRRVSIRSRYQRADAKEVIYTQGS